MKDKALKFRPAKPVHEERLKHLREIFNGDECKVQFAVWSDGVYLDVAGLWDGEPIFRPASCAWEAWKAAWVLRAPEA